MTRISVLSTLLVVLAVACASQHPGRTRLPDGSYKVECRKPLGDCLYELEGVCADHGYEVIQATEERSRAGVEPVMSEYVVSRAVVRCRSGVALLHESAKAPASAAPAPAAQRCFPGSTQACLGSAACKGAQTCQSDGARFGPCDCGPASPRADVSPSGDGGPPPTWAVPPDGGAPP